MGESQGDYRDWRSVCTMSVMKPFAMCCSVVSGFGVLMLATVGYFLGTGTDLLGEIGETEEDKHSAAGRCYGAAMVYAVFFCLSIAGIKFGKGDEDAVQLLKY